LILFFGEPRVYEHGIQKKQLISPVVHFKKVGPKVVSILFKIDRANLVGGHPVHPFVADIMVSRYAIKRNLEAACNTFKFSNGLLKTRKTWNGVNDVT
jgi:hypothetical protein